MSPATTVSTLESANPIVPSGSVSPIIVVNQVIIDRRYNASGHHSGQISLTG